MHLTFAQSAASPERIHHRLSKSAHITKKIYCCQLEAADWYKLENRGLFDVPYFSSL